MFNDELAELDKFKPMTSHYEQSLSSIYLSGPGFALPISSKRQSSNPEPINLHISNIPFDLEKEGLIRLFKTAKVQPLDCKLFKNSLDHYTAIVQVNSVFQATQAIQALNNRPPIKLRITLAAKREEFEKKRELLKREQEEEAELRRQSIANNENKNNNNDRTYDETKKMAEIVNNLAAVENLFKILPSRTHKCFACDIDPPVKHVHFCVAEELIVNPFEGLPETIAVECSNCLASEGKFILCSKCKTTVYCGKKCQFNDWSKHQKECSNKSHLVNSANESKTDEPLKKKLSDKSVIVNGTNEGKTDGPIVENSSDKVHLINGISKNKTDEPIVRKSSDKVHFDNGSNEIKTDEPIVRKSSSKVHLDNGSNVIKTDEPVVKNSVDKLHIGNVGYEVKTDVSSEKKYNRRQKITLNNAITAIKETRFEPKTTENVVFSFSCSPHEFYCQRLEDGALAEKITLRLIEACSKTPEWEDVDKLKFGQYCAALFKADNCWYRAKVISVEPTRVLVKFIDYGNQDLIKPCDLRPLPPDLAAHPSLAICCSLHRIRPSSDGPWSKEAITTFETFLDDDNENPFHICKVISADIDTSTYSVELYNAKDESLAEILVERGLARFIPEPMGRRIGLIRRSRTSYPDDDGQFEHSSPPRKNHNNDNNEIGSFNHQRYRSPSPPKAKPTEGSKQSHETQKTSCITPRDPKKEDHQFAGIRKEDQSSTQQTGSNRLINRKKTAADYYHLYKMESPNTKESVILYNDPDDPSTIFILGNNDNMLEICEELGQLTEKRKIESLPGTFAIALCDDGDYYRILILENMGDKSRCYFVDFGNEDIICNSKIFALPRQIDLTNIPAQGIRCRVENMNKIQNYLERLTHAISEGNPVPINVTGPLSDQEYSVRLSI